MPDAVTVLCEQEAVEEHVSDTAFDVEGDGVGE